MSSRLGLALVPVLFVFGCGDDSASAGGDLALADLSIAQGTDLATSAYPAGPYGHDVGSTIAPLVWEGYADPLADALATTKPYGPYSMNDLRLSGKAYGIVHLSAFS
jgi:hypothetical protein